ncbi:hypothetical protein Tco_0919695 [Tanacetum coccineum]
MTNNQTHPLGADQKTKRTLWVLTLNPTHPVGAKTNQRTLWCSDEKPNAPLLMRRTKRTPLVWLYSDCGRVKMVVTVVVWVVSAIGGDDGAKVVWFGGGDEGGAWRGGDGVVADVVGGRSWPDLPERRQKFLERDEMKCG